MSMGDRTRRNDRMSLHASFNLTSLSMAESHVHRHTARRHSVGHCNFTDTLARAIGTGVCTGLCKQAHPAGVITPLRVIDNVRERRKERESERELDRGDREERTRARARERERERERWKGGEEKEERCNPRAFVSLMSIRCPAKGLSIHAARSTHFGNPLSWDTHPIRRFRLLHRIRQPRILTTTRGPMVDHCFEVKSILAP